MVDGSSCIRSVLVTVSTSLVDRTATVQPHSPAVDIARAVCTRHGISSTGPSRGCWGAGCGLLQLVRVPERLNTVCCFEKSLRPHTERELGGCTALCCYLCAATRRRQRSERHSDLQTGRSRRTHSHQSQHQRTEGRTARLPHTPGQLTRPRHTDSGTDNVRAVSPLSPSEPRVCACVCALQLGNLTQGCTTAGGHYNPQQRSHGDMADTERHVGDMGNITSKSGKAQYDAVSRHGNTDERTRVDRSSTHRPHSLCWSCAAIVSSAAVHRWTSCV